MSKLKPCPFCGRKAELHYYEIDEPFTFTECGYEIYCCHCGIRFKERLNRIPQFDEKADIKKQNLIERWNRRVNDGVESNEADTEEVVRRIKEEYDITDGWIPCSERLPDEETDVLVTRTFLGCKDGSFGWNNHIPPSTYVEVAQYFAGEWTALSDEYKVARSRHTDPVAWMPLPKPYREEDEV